MYCRTKKSAPTFSLSFRQASISSLDMVLTTVMRTKGTFMAASAVKRRIAGRAFKPNLLWHTAS